MEYLQTLQDILAEDRYLYILNGLGFSVGVTFCGDFRNFIGNSVSLTEIISNRNSCPKLPYCTLILCVERRLLYN